MTPDIIDEMRDDSTMSGPVSGSVSQDIEQGSESGIRPREEDEWERIKNENLIEWGANPERFTNEGMTPPPRELIQGLIQLIETVKEDMPAPDRVVPDPNGGISFWYETDEKRHRVDFQADFKIEFLEFHDNELISRESLPEKIFSVIK